MSATEEETVGQAEAEESEGRALEAGVPPAGEEIHLPGPSAIPIITAVGITLAVIGTTIDWKIWSTMGVAITVVCIVLWVRSTKREVAALPEEHSH
jgi:hypothetical protein